jgi:hypothetical protein
MAAAIIISLTRVSGRLRRGQNQLRAATATARNSISLIIDCFTLNRRCDPCEKAIRRSGDSADRRRRALPRIGVLYLIVGMLANVFDQIGTALLTGARISFCQKLAATRS